MIEIKQQLMPGSVVVAGSGNEIDVLFDGMTIDCPPLVTPRSYVNLSEVWQSLTADEKNFIGLDICVGFLGRKQGVLIFNALTRDMAILKV